MEVWICLRRARMEHDTVFNGFPTLGLEKQELAVFAEWLIELEEAEQS